MIFEDGAFFGLCAQGLFKSTVGASHIGLPLLSDRWKPIEAIKYAVRVFCSSFAK